MFIFYLIVFNIFINVNQDVIGLVDFVRLAQRTVNDAIKKGELNEVEPVGIALLNIDSITDGFPWNHPLPTETK
jgi:hypothetical protein